MFRRAQENYCHNEFLKIIQMNEVCANPDRENPGVVNLEHAKFKLQVVSMICAMHVCLVVYKLICFISVEI